MCVDTLIHLYGYFLIVIELKCPDTGKEIGRIRHSRNHFSREEQEVR